MTKADWNRNPTLAALIAAAVLYNAAITYNNSATYYNGYNRIGQTPDGSKPTDYAPVATSKANWSQVT